MLCVQKIYMYLKENIISYQILHIQKKYRHNLRPHAACRFFSLNINATRTRSQFIFLIQCAARDKCAFDPSAINECGLNCLGIFWYAPYHATIQNNDSLTTSHHVCVCAQNYAHAALLSCWAFVQCDETYYARGMRWRKKKKKKTTREKKQ